MTNLERLTEAAWAGDLATVENLIAAGVDVNAPSAEGRLPPLHLAMENQRIETLRRLIEAGADVNRDLGGGWTPLVHAIDIESDAAWQHGKSPEETPTVLVEMLLSAGAVPTPEALAIAERYENHRAVALLRRGGVQT